MFGIELVGDVNGDLGNIIIADVAFVSYIISSIQVSDTYRN
jgi:hypothetical protein